MKILLSCYSFKNYTGSELYFYELAKGLQELGHEVFIHTLNLGLPLVSKIDNVVYLIDNDINNYKFDKVIFSHGLATWNDIKNANADEFINVIHSEVLTMENPIKDRRVDRYVGIRPSIVNFVNELIKHLNKETELIYNPFDLSRFNVDNCRKDESNQKVVLFPGSLDYLRYKPVMLLLEKSVEEGFKVIHVGRNDYNIKHENFETYEATWNIENYYRKCDIVSGIYLGRTSIEGLLCGKRVLQFDVDRYGNIDNYYWHSESNLFKFDRINVAKRLIRSE